MDKPPIRILLVEDNPADARLLQLLLAEKTSFPSRWTHVQRLSEAIEHLAQDQIDVVLLDLSLPDAQGLDTLTSLQSHASHLPIVVITGLNDDTLALQAMHAGAQDYLVKGQMDGELLARTLRYSIERRQAEEGLTARERRFRALVEHAPDGIALLGMDGKLQQVTPTVQQILGYSTEESVGQDPALLTHPDDLPDLLVLLNDLIQHPDQVARTVYRFRHKDGSWRWLESIVSNLMSEPSVNAIVFNYRDITERRQAEEYIRYQSNLLQNVSDAIIGTDVDFHVMSWNPAAEEMYGWGPQEVMGKPVDDFLQTKYEQTAGEEVLRQFREQGSWQGEAVQRRKDGTPITVLASVSQMKDGSGKVIGVVAINRDITERKQAEVRIQRQVHRLSSLRAIDLAISSTFDRNISLAILLNEAVTQLGVDAAAILVLDPTTLTLQYAAGQGFTTSEIRNSHLRMGEGLAGQAALERHKVYILDLEQAGSEFVRRGTLKDEMFRSYLAIPLIAKGEVKGVLEIFQRSQLEANSEWLDFLETLGGQAGIAIENAQLFDDLHRSNMDLERRVAERTAELNRTNAELERANRTKDEFLANMSHELRTPLTSILGLSESLIEQRHGSLTEYQEKSIKIVESSGRHLLELINDILDLSKIEAGRFDFYPQPVSVEEFCRSCLSFIKSLALKKSITVTYTNEAPVSKILADPRRLKQVLINLLMNAVKFTPEHGGVTLQVTSDPDEEIIHFSVIDTGIGIAPEDLQRLFQPFMQVDSSLNRQYEGTGLGLALVQRLTDLHGGSVTVESEVGKGSRFTINLACKGTEVSRLEAAESHAPLPVHEREAKPDTGIDLSAPPRLILLAEDNIANILTIGEYLKSYGYDVITARDGLETIQKAVQIGPNLILMDIQMPVIDGMEAMARLRSNPRFAHTPIIALTALAMSGDRERCLLAGASEYMSKPVSLKALRQTIEALLQNGR